DELRVELLRDLLAHFETANADRRPEERGRFGWIKAHGVERRRRDVLNRPAPSRMDVCDDAAHRIDDRDRQTICDFDDQRAVSCVRPNRVAFGFIDRSTTNFRAMDLMTTRDRR